MHIEPYLFFNGHCDEAIEFYRRALGAEVTMLMRFKESPDAGQIPPGSDDKVMHASLRIGDTTVLASDGHSTGTPSFQGFALSITLPDESKVERYFAALADATPAEDCAHADVGRAKREHSGRRHGGSWSRMFFATSPN